MSHYQTQPAAAQKKKHTGLKIAGAVAGVLLLIGALATLTAEQDKGDAVAVAGTSTAAPAAVKTKAPAPKKWVTLTTLKGKSPKSSDTIKTTGGRVRLSYAFSGGEYMVGTIYLLKEGTDLNVDGGIPDVSVSQEMADSTILRKAAGSYFVHVTSANTTYTVTVAEER